MKIKKWQVGILFFAGILALQYLSCAPVSQSRHNQPHFKYVVEQGDTCSNIAHAFGVSAESIIELNKLKQDCSNIHPGHALLIPYPTPTVTPFGFVFISPTSHRIVDCELAYYTVKKGDTLESISKSYDIPLEVLIDFNGIVNKENATKRGNILVIPLCHPTPEKISSSITSTPLPIIDIFPACQVIQVSVLQGDTLDAISANYAVPKDYIKQYNRMKADEIFPGMKLLIPMCHNMPTPTETPID